MSILLSYKDVDIYRDDANCLLKANWLNDACISFAFRCIEDKMIRFFKDMSILMDPSVVSFMRIQAIDDEENDELAVSLGIQHKTWLFVPVNDNDSFGNSSTHWSLLVCHIPTGHMYHFDSHAPYNWNAAMKTALRVQRLIYRPSHSLVSIDCPRQSNGGDCGVYAVLFTEEICAFLQSSPSWSASSGAGEESAESSTSATVSSGGDDDRIASNPAELSAALHSNVDTEKARIFREQTLADINNRALTYKRK